MLSLVIHYYSKDVLFLLFLSILDPKLESDRLQLEPLSKLKKCDFNKQTKLTKVDSVIHTQVLYGRSRQRMKRFKANPLRFT